MRDSIRLVLATSWQPNKQLFLEQLGVSEGGLGEQLFGKVYDAFFVHSTEMKREFDRYYSVEYGTPENYARLVHGLELSGDDLGHDMIFLVNSLPVIVDDLYDDSALEKVLACVKQLEKVQNETKA